MIKTTVLEAANSTAANPRWVWHVWRRAREVSMGFSDSEEDARHQAELVAQRIEARFEGRRYNEIITERRTDEQTFLDLLQSAR